MIPNKVETEPIDIATKGKSQERNCFLITAQNNAIMANYAEVKICNRIVSVGYAEKGMKRLIAL